jgi:hypothetical protein
MKILELTTAITKRKISQEEVNSRF